MNDTAPPNTGLPVSPGEGRYLCGMLYLTLLDDPPVGNGELADYLDVSGASVTEMIETFDEMGLVAHEPYLGATLTEEGEALAREILWRQCTVQQFFDRAGGVDLRNEQAYRIACLLDEASVLSLIGQADRPCRDHCRATSAEDCPELVV